MTLPASGAISISQVSVELGRASTATTSLGESAVRTLAGVSSGAISLSNLYGKANQFSFTISTNQIDLNLRNLAISNGWNGTSALAVTIASGVYIYSNSTGTPALTINGSFPSGITLINNGTIEGRGGNGGAGGNVVSTSASPGAVGGGGGTALSVSVATSITNNGVIAGGGGGGGGGGGTRYGGKNTEFNAGGGGGGGIGISSGGAGGVASGGYINRAGTAGTAGTLTTVGVGGASSNTTNGMGRGGDGGSYGSSGVNGLAGYSGAIYYGAGGAGGAAGSCTAGNSNITWLSTGTRYGALN